MSDPAFDQPGAPGTPRNNALGLAGFIVSLVGLLACGGLLSPIGLVISALGLKREPRGFAIAGLVLGIVGSLWIIVVICFIGVGAVLAAIGLGAAVSSGFAELVIDGNTIRESVRESIRAGATPTSLDDLKGLSDGAKKDKWDRPYHFTLSADKKSFTIVSDGPDGQPGTDDDVKNEMGLDSE